tara:strand:- start:511 stop:798 length:288 start_codon:yes stop_codon:yes gene_type:complete
MKIQYSNKPQLFKKKRSCKNQLNNKKVFLKIQLLIRTSKLVKRRVRVEEKVAEIVNEREIGRIRVSIVSIQVVINLKTFQMMGMKWNLRIKDQSF